MSIDVLRSKFSRLSKDDLLSLIGDIIQEFKQPVIEFVEARLAAGSENAVKTKKKLYKQENIDFSKYHQRQIALQIQYDGTAYLGFAAQGGEDDSLSVEDKIFSALEKLKLVADRKSCNYSRCGRTDKGVSALGQIISVKVRSAFPKEVVEKGEVILPIHPGDEVLMNIASDSNNRSTTRTTKTIKEMDYASMLNKNLPDDIRIVGWCEVSPEFSSRFSAAHRGYRYFFIQKNRNIDAMKVAASSLVGYHDFRNICKLDVVNVTNFKREIFSADIVCYDSNVSDSSKSIWMLEIKGVAFLWHMVRCIMAVLFMVGEHNESPDIVKQLLDVDQYQSKPSYRMAPEQPLVLHECGYDNLHICMLPKNLWNLTAHYEALMEYHIIAAMRAKNSLEYIRNGVVREVDLKQYIIEIEEKVNRKARGKNAQQKIFSSTLSSDVSVGVVWNNALDIIEKEFNIIPEVVPVPYVPLFERKCEETLAEKQVNLSGTKKERLHRHIEITADNKEETPKFFKKMRMQGSLQASIAQQQQPQSDDS